MQKKKLTRTLAVLLSAAFVLSGCGASGSSSDSSSGSTASTASTSTGTKDVLNLAITANPPTLDSHISDSNIAAEIAMNIYEPLFAMNADYEPTAVLADSYEVSDDGLVYTIKLRQGIKFHNGDEMKADDVVASMTRWLRVSSKANALLDGSVFAKVDDYTITLTVPQATSDVLQILAGPAQFAAIYPQSIAENASDDGITEYIGTGPYKFDDWKKDQYVQLVKNEDYQSPKGEPSGFTGEKTAATPTLKYIVVTDDATREAGLKTGEYDSGEDISQEFYAEMAEDDSLSIATRASGSLNLFLNTTQGVLKDEKIRQAVLAALNSKDIMAASIGDENFYTLDPGWFNESNAQWSSDAGKEYYNQNDPDKAKKLLEEAGYNNEKIVLVTTPDYNEMYNATLVVQEELRQAGFNAEVESYDFNTFMEHRADPAQFDMFITSNGYNLLPVQLSVLTAKWAGLDTPEVSEGIKAIRGAASDEDASKAWDDLQLYLYEYGAASVLGHYSDMVVTTSKMQNFEYFRYPVFWNATVSQ
ncbi:ABC transporter substrate-binding protein [Hespellia stercorisuis]|uniref:Peptide/nickel transport system substrate-binding protein n=1 Tax=Hespellia stercorisuis DSM 15480 TaxID=1121950 RepID=A0A1M6TGR3_9FIRM|nr:ABC transporter substrate-binding protein [Hespellia stercorisuis]SHK56026.1 peptide/nickel transport system substrate-binding protein [Hespellia stercorisuis DSM 15480]